MPRIYGNLQEPKRDWSNLRRALARLLWLGGVIGLVYLLFFSQVFTVKSVEVQGTRLADPTQLAETIPRGQSMWRLSDEYLQEIVAADPIIASAWISRGFPSSVRVIVQEREPVLLWVSAGTSHLVDTNGVVFLQFATDNPPPADTPLAEVVAELPRVVDSQNIPVERGQTVAGSSFVEFIRSAQTAFAAYLPDVVWDRAEVGATLYEVTYSSTSGLRVTFNALADSGAQIRNLARLRNQGKVTETSSVDLRIDRWAYVREAQ